jgi:hypothetical protein
MRGREGAAIALNPIGQLRSALGAAVRVNRLNRRVFYTIRKILKIREGLSDFSKGYSVQTLPLKNYPLSIGDKNLYKSTKTYRFESGLAGLQD